MPRWLQYQGNTPIGIDIGSRSVKLVQFTRDQSRIVDTARWDMPGDPDAKANAEQQTDRFVEALHRAREGRQFRGKDAVICLNARQLFLQNIRVPKAEKSAVDLAVQQEAAGRVPFPIAEAEIRYIEAADIRQGDQVLREIILMACHRPVLEQALEIIDKAGLRPVAVDVEPMALLRAYCSQFRRDEDRNIRSLIVHMGNASTLIMIAHQGEALFIKYLDLGGKHIDEAVARSLKMDLPGATALRRHNGDRRSDRQDPEIARSLNDASRPILDKLYNELAMCIRYHNVTFRGCPLERLVLGGGEATPQLLTSLNDRLGLKGELSDPFRAFDAVASRGRLGQWDIASGLAMRNVGKI